MTSINKIMTGLQILTKYVDPDDACGIDAQHDIIYSGPYIDGDNPVSAEDQEQLSQLGWHIDEENQCYAHFT